MSEIGSDVGKGQNNFGKEWRELERPVVGVVNAIDDIGEDLQECRIGLSAKQLRNLDIKKLGGTHDAESLFRAVLRNQEGLTDDKEYESVIVSFEKKQAYAQVYNAFGELSFAGSGVRISARLAKELGAKIGSEVSIDKPQDAFQLDDSTKNI